MGAVMAETADKTVDTVGASEHFGERGMPYSPRTLEGWRCEGFGPPYLKPRAKRGIIRYRLRDLDEWLAAQIVEPNGSRRARTRRKAS